MAENNNAETTEEVEVNGERYTVNVAPANPAAQNAARYTPSAQDVGKRAGVGDLPVWEDG